MKTDYFSYLLVTVSIQKEKKKKAEIWNHAFPYTVAFVRQDWMKQAISK